MQDPYDYIDCQNCPHTQFNYNSYKPYPTTTGWGFGGNVDLTQITGELQNNETEFSNHEIIETSDLNSCFILSDWDIKDVVLPQPVFYHSFDMWPDGDCHLIYCASNNKSRKHKSGWAMRNTNNHNKMILKKSCLGVIKCNKNCWYPNHGNVVRLAPKISEAARRCQLNNKPCPNPNCNGYLVQQTCTGKSGNPVTHYWRYSQQTNSIYFMARGIHNHEKPNIQIKMNDKRLRSETLNFSETNQCKFQIMENKFDRKISQVKTENQVRINPDNIFNIPNEFAYSTYNDTKSYQQMMIRSQIEIFQPDLNRSLQYVSPVYNSSVSNSTDSVSENWSNVNVMKSSPEFLNDNIQRFYCSEYQSDQNITNNMDYSLQNLPFEISWNHECIPEEHKLEITNEPILISEEINDFINKNQMNNVNLKFSFRSELEMLDGFAK